MKKLKMKISLVLLVIVFLVGCNTKYDILSDKYDAAKNSYDSFDVCFYKRNDSCKAINVFIDNLPSSLKYNAVINDGYMRNISYLLQQNRKRGEYLNRMDSINQEMKNIYHP